MVFNPIALAFLPKDEILLKMSMALEGKLKDQGDAGCGRVWYRKAELIPFLPHKSQPWGWLPLADFEMPFTPNRLSLS